MIVHVCTATIAGLQAPHEITGAPGTPGACDPELLGLTRGHDGWDALPSTSLTFCTGSRTGKLPDVPIRCGPLDRGGRSPMHHPTSPHTLHGDFERRSKQCQESENDQTPDCSRHLASQGESREHRRLRPRSFTRTHQNEGARCTRPLRHSGAPGRYGQPMHPWQKRKC